MKRYSPTIFLFFCGMLAAASMPDAGVGAWVWDATPYSFLTYAAAIGTLFAALSTDQHQTRRIIFIHVYAWAFGYHLMGLNWIGNALLVDGNPFVWAYPLALIGLPLILAPFLAIPFAALPPRIWRGPQKWIPPLFVIVFFAGEMARSYLFTGFPWNTPAFLWAGTLTMFQNLHWAGADGLSLLTLVWAIAAYFCARPSHGRQHHLFIGLSGISLGLCLAYGTTRLQTEPPPLPAQFVLVQANIPQADKWNPDHFADHFYDHILLSVRDKNLPDRPTMVIWPETTLPPNFVDAPVVRQAIADLLATYPKDSVLVTGAVRTESEQYYNSALVYDRTGQIVATYDKHHLVPFGEYIPLQKYIPFGPITEFDGLGAGSGPTTLALPELPAFSPLICYEIIFGHETIDRTHPPSLLINLTNDSWYGNSAGPHQHLAQARARAIEYGLPVVRVAGTGISAVIDSYGHIVQQMPYGTRGSIFQPTRSKVEYTDLK